MGVRQIRALRLIAGGDDPLPDLDTAAAASHQVGTGSQSPAGSGPFGSTGGQTAGRAHRGPAKTRLVLNLDATALDGEPLARIGTVERLGPITLAKIRDWLDQTDVTLTPVSRQGRVDTVDVHDPPWWMAETGPSA